MLLPTGVFRAHNALWRALRCARDFARTAARILRPDILEVRVYTWPLPIYTPRVQPCSAAGEVEGGPQRTRETTIAWHDIARGLRRQFLDPDLAHG